MSLFSRDGSKRPPGASPDESSSKGMGLTDGRALKVLLRRHHRDITWIYKRIIIVVVVVVRNRGNFPSGHPLCKLGSLDSSQLLYFDQDWISSFILYTMIFQRLYKYSIYCVPALISSGFNIVAVLYI